MSSIIYIIFLIVLSFYRIVTGYNCFTYKEQNKNKVLGILAVEIITLIYLFISKIIPLTTPAVLILGILSSEVLISMKNTAVILSIIYLIFDFYVVFRIVKKSFVNKKKIFVRVTGVIFMINGIFLAFIFI